MHWLYRLTCFNCPILSLHLRVDVLHHWILEEEPVESVVTLLIALLSLLLTYVHAILQEIVSYGSR